MVEYIGCEPLYKDVTVRDNTARDLGVLLVQPRSDSLEAVIVTPRNIRPRIHGDTLEYGVRSVRMNHNASVEELLRRLPGIEIAADGTIRYYGQKIDQLMIDGEDVFGASPGIITRNFNADLIDKVQLLDKKSQQAEFTGLDDGTRIKGLNLAIREERKSGYFGKAEAGGDAGDYYNADALVGSFAGRRQIIGLGILSDVGNTGFGGGAGDAQASLSVSGATTDPLGASAGVGVPKIAATGLHYANTWNGRDDHLAGNYQYGHVYTEPVTSNTTVQTLPDTLYLQQQQSHSINSQYQQKVDVLYDVGPGDLSAWQLSFGGLNMQGKNRYGSTGSSAFNDTLINTSQGTISSDVMNQNLSGGLSWRMMTRNKRSRVISAAVYFSEKKNTTNGYVYALDNYYQTNGSLLITDTTDQRKQIIGNNDMINATVSCTDSLDRHTLWGMRYEFTANNSQSVQSIYNRGEDGKYQDYIDSLSDNYKDFSTEQKATVFVVNQLAKLKLTLGGDLISDACRQNDLLLNSTFHYDYLSFIPHILVRYALSNVRSLFFNYIGETQQPTFQQLQPVQNVTDPLHISIGNPGLRPEYTNRISLNFRQFTSNTINLWLFLNAGRNDISTRTYTDSLGRQISQPVNVSGARGGSLVFSLDWRLKPLDLEAGFNSRGTYTHSVNYVNTDLSRNNIYTGALGLHLSKYVADEYNFRITTQFVYSYSQSSVDPTAAIAYWTQNHTAEIGYFPSSTFELNTSLTYSWRQKASAFDANNETLIWNSYVNKDFWDHKLSLRGSVNNILNQNAGISRTSAINETTQTVTNTIGRYWMLSLAWHFDHHWKRK